jgi:hypothetical protein
LLLLLLVAVVVLLLLLFVIVVTAPIWFAREESFKKTDRIRYRSHTKYARGVVIHIYICIYSRERERERCARTPSKIAAAAAVVVSSSSSSSSSVPSLRSQILLEYALFPFSHNQLLRSNE